MIGVHFIIDNKSNKDISTYPTQGTLLTNTREQIKASVHSDNFDGDLVLAVIGFWYMGSPVHNEQSDDNNQETSSSLTDTASVDVNEDEVEEDLNLDDTINHKVDWSVNKDNNRCPHAGNLPSLVLKCKCSF
ncbi:hypothetical protein DT075_16850 [Bacillus licheniformis]|nr:hypothetical protein DT075_16850 [Bacillus licheniformis]